MTQRPAEFTLLSLWARSDSAFISKQPLKLCIGQALRASIGACAVECGTECRERFARKKLIPAP